MALLYLGLGSNLGNRKAILLQAIEELKKRIGTCQRLSAFYETAPWGFRSSHTFLNAVAAFYTELSPEQALFITQDIEKHLGRTHKSHGGQYADRSIDIDLLLYDNIILDADYTDYNSHTVHLTLPHPLMHERLFVMEPLAEIAPDGMHPVLHKTYSQLLTELQTPKD